jgi:hypothetical protein
LDSASDVSVLGMCDPGQSRQHEQDREHQEHQLSEPQREWFGIQQI